MRVRNAYRVSYKPSKYSIAVFLIWSVGTLLLFSAQLNLLIAIVFALLGVAVLIFAINKDHATQNLSIEHYKKRLQSNFQCPQCKQNIDNPLEFEEKNGTPVLFECKTCEVLWYAGSYSESHA